MKTDNRRWWSLVLLSLALTVTALFGACSRCTDTVYKYAGGGDPGDFYTFTINETDSTYTYSNLITGVSRSGSFTKTETAGLYKIDKGYYCVYLPGQILVAQAIVNERPRLVVALKRALDPYGIEIAGDYYWINLRGVLGSATFDTDENEPTEGVINGSSSEGTLEASYSFTKKYKAIKFVHSAASIRPGHYGYGVFLENNASVWDSYDETGAAAGVSVALKKLTAPDKSSYAGTYVYLDRYGGHGTYTVTVTGGNLENIAYDGVNGSGEPRSGVIPGSAVTDYGDGRLSFFIDSKFWNILLLPTGIMVGGCEESGASGNLFVGVKQS